MLGHTTVDRLRQSIKHDKMKTNSIYESAAATVALIGPIPNVEGEFADQPDRFAVRIAGNAQQVSHGQAIMTWLLGRNRNRAGQFQRDMVEFFDFLAKAPTSGSTWTNWPMVSPVTLIDMNYLHHQRLIDNSYAERVFHAMTASRCRMFKLEHSKLFTTEGFTTFCLDFVTENFNSVIWPSFTPHSVICMIEPKEVKLAPKQLPRPEPVYLDDRQVGMPFGLLSPTQISPNSNTNLASVTASSSNFKSRPSPGSLVVPHHVTKRRERRKLSKKGN